MWHRLSSVRDQTGASRARTSPRLTTGPSVGPPRPPRLPPSHRRRGHPVVLGDKAHSEVWKTFNEDCCLDLGERGQAAGYHDLVVEVKAWGYLHADSTPVPHADLARRGATKDPWLRRHP
jgi:hypothetical protein